MSDISSAFQLSLNGKEAELASMLKSRMIDADACQTTGMYAGWSLLHAAASKGHMRIVQRLLAAVFQAASQFNCLEMMSPSVSPAAGVGIYVNDPTQGPACALACPAATVYRNYLVQHEGNTGQHPVQIDNLKAVGVAVGNDDGRYWAMQNGYAMPVGRDSLTELAARLRTEPNLVEQAEAALRVGVHWETS
ncbi:protein-tyrosine dual specificity domain protein, partial [Chrysochromulina tobinii]